MDWLSDAPGGVDLPEILEIFTAGSLLGFCLIPTFALLFLIAFIKCLIKWRKKRKKNSKNTVNKTNVSKKNNTDKIEVVQLGRTPTKRNKRHTGLGMTGDQLHAELGYDTVDSRVLDNMTEPSHSMDLNIEFDSNGKTVNRRRK